MARYDYDYMTRFHCIGPDCEDTCCTGWRVHLPKEDLDKLMPLIEKEGHRELADAIEILPEEERHDGNHGHLVHGKDGKCQMLDQGWCRLHRDLGEAMLPLVCATFPRLIIDTGKNRETSGRLSCPEVARLCLLADHAPTLVPDELPLPPLYETHSWAVQEQEPFRKNLEPTARIIRTLLDLSSFPLDERLYFVLYFCKRISPFMYMDCKKDPASRIERLGKRMADLGFLKNIAVGFNNDAHHSAQLIDFLFGILNANFVSAHYVRYNNLRLTLLRGLGKGEADPLACSGRITNETSLDDLFHRYQERKQVVLDRFGERINRYFTNFAVNYWLQHLYMGDPEIETPLRKFFVYLALSRILFFAHPEVVACTRIEEDEAAIARLDELIVEIIQVFMKTIDANVEVLHSILAAVKELKLEGMAELAAFIKI